MDDMKRCSKCKMDCLKTTFHKNKKSKDGLISQCKPCEKHYRKSYYIENRDIEHEYYKKYYNENQDKF